jgi:glycosyltransferase involved in cell wall biosynthesis
MADTFRISVVTPSFNQAQFLEATLQSIHDQDYPDLEHIVIDGGSTDGSVEIIKRYEHKLAYWVSEEDEGQTDALVKGFARATGDIHCWLNSDDLFEPGALSEVSEYFRRHPKVRFIYGDSTWIDKEGNPVKRKREHRWSRFVWMYYHNFIPQPSAFWRAELYHAAGGLDPKFEYAMDADLWIRFADLTHPRHVRRAWSKMRFYPEQKNSRFRTKTSFEGKSIRSRYGLPVSRRRAKFRKFAARVLRVLLKSLAGGYSLPEATLHLGTLVGRGTWEQREARRQLDSR